MIPGLFIQMIPGLSVLSILTRNFALLNVYYMIWATKSPEQHFMDQNN